MEKILSIFLKLNFTPNTLGCNGLIIIYNQQCYFFFHQTDRWMFSNPFYFGQARDSGSLTISVS